MLDDRVKFWESHSASLARCGVRARAEIGMARLGVTAGTQPLRADADARGIVRVFVVPLAPPFDALNTLTTKQCHSLGSLPMSKVAGVVIATALAGCSRSSGKTGSSDTNPGVTYIFNRASKALTEVGKAKPSLENRTLATVKAIEVPAQDGVRIPAYLTLPPGSSGKNLPAVVFPHG